MKWICGEKAPIFYEWFEARMPELSAPFDRNRTGVLALLQDHKILCVVVFADYSGHSVTLHIVAETGKQWMTRRFLFAVFDYAFRQLGVRRITVPVVATNTQSLRFVKHLGWKEEGRLRRGSKDGSDIVVFGMLKEECRFLRMRDESKQTLAVAS